MSGFAVDLGEAKALIGVIGDGEHLEGVCNLVDEIEVSLVSSLEEGGVPGAGSAGKSVRGLLIC